MTTRGKDQLIDTQCSVSWRHGDNESWERCQRLGVPYEGEYLCGECYRDTVLCQNCYSRPRAEPGGCGWCWVCNEKWSVS